MSLPNYYDDFGVTLRLAARAASICINDAVKRGWIKNPMDAAVGLYTDDPRAKDHPCYAYRVGKPDARDPVQP